MQPSHAAPLLCALLTPLAGCLVPDTARPVVVRDSAGVTIVENSPATSPADVRWRIDAPATARIGVVMGDPRYEFAQVRGAFRLQDGTIVVAAAGSEDIRGYDPAGIHRWTVGGRGDGPGEFRNLRTLLRTAGDTLVVVDRFGARITRLHPDGQILDVSLRSATAGVPLGMFGDRSTVRWTYSGIVPMTQLGRVRDELAFVVDHNRFVPSIEAARGDAGVTGASYDASTPRVQGDTIVRIPGNDEYRWQLGQGIANEPVPFGRDVVTAVAHDLLHVAGGEVFEVMTWDRAGTLRRIVRLMEPPAPLSSAEIERWKTWRRSLVRTPEQQAAVERVIAEQQFPEHRPAISGLFVDRDAHLWVERYRTLRDDPQRWVVFDPDGLLAGEIDLPPRFTITDVGADWLLGIARDEEDVETVQLFRLTRS